MKSKFAKTFGFALCMIAAGLFCFAGCGNTGFAENPAKDAPVYGNGGTAVQKGDFLYFINGFTKAEDVKDTNNFGDVKYPALYRVKLDENGKVVEKDPEYDEDGNEKFDGSQGLKNVDLLASKVVGFEGMSLYIFGDYIYFTTPNNQKGGDLEVRTDLIDFCRIKLDNTGRLEKLYTSANSNDSVSFTMYQIENTVYQVIFDKDKIAVNTISQNGSFSNYTTPKEYAITSVALAKYDSSLTPVQAIDSNIYFTYVPEDVTIGNALCSLNLGTKEITTVIQDNNTTFTLKASVGGNVYYTAKQATAPGMDEKLFFSDTMSEASLKLNDGDNMSKYQVTANSYTAYIPVAGDLGVGAVVSDGSALFVIRKGATPRKLVDSSSATFVKVQGDYVYYIQDVKIKRINYVDPDATEEVITPSSVTLMGDKPQYVSIQGNKIYYFKQYSNDSSTRNYMHVTDLSEKTDDGAYYDHFIGVMMEEDYLTESK